MTRLSVWVAGQDLAQNRCALTAVGPAGAVGLCQPGLEVSLVQNWSAHSGYQPGHWVLIWGEGGWGGDIVTCTMVKVDWSYVRVCLS